MSLDNAAVAPALVDLPVVFSGDGVSKTFDRPPEGTGGEGIGVWHEGDKAWKVSTATNKLEKLKRDYRTAKDENLPIGGVYEIKEGKVTQGGGRQRDGYVLITKWLDGHQFDFHGGKPFRRALEDEKVSHSRTSDQYIRAKRACEVADKLGLNDVQGKVNGRTGVSEPVAFFDINVTGSSTGQTTQLVEAITAWGTDP